MLSTEEIIAEVAHQMKQKFSGEETGHDWYHIERVWKNAKLISANEECDPFIVELGALLHDVADHKFVEDFEKETNERVNQILSALNVSSDAIEQVLHIVHNCSFKGGIGENKMKSIEGLIVQDADRLDAIGAIGIARTFAFGGKFGNMIYDPEVLPVDFQSEDQYRKTRTHTINHFYEKLLKLKQLMNTTTGKSLAEKRHQYMEEFLKQFYGEWEGKF
ncbi:MAG: HD domain-containing protein [Crocinitomicaceae bacterium]|nr:HD domain-containing protein [Crocinitomicaceae bacterium]